MLRVAVSRSRRGFRHRDRLKMRQPLPVLFAHFGEDWIRGSEQVLLDLLATLDRGRIAPVVWCNADAMAAACRRLGVPTHQSRFAFYLDYNSPRFSPSHYAGLVRQGLRLLRDHGIAVIHANSAAPAQWLVPVARLGHRPLLVHLHINYLRRSRYALLLHMAEMIVGVSRQAAEDLLADGMAPDRVRLIHNGLDFARLATAEGDLRSRLGIPPEAPVIAAIGSLVLRKGFDILLRAFADLPQTGAPAPVLLIGGDGEQRAQFETMAAELGVGSRVRFLGYTDAPAAIYRSADIFALASRNDACPLVLIEAGHFSLPVVATAVGGVPEIIVEGETGFLVPPEDATALRDRLQRLLQEPSTRARMGAAARERVDSMFTVARMTGDFMDCYEQLAAAPPGKGSRLARLRPYARLLGLSPRRA